MFPILCCFCGPETDCVVIESSRLHIAVNCLLFSKSWFVFVLVGVVGGGDALPLLVVRLAKYDIPNRFSQVPHSQGLQGAASLRVPPLLLLLGLCFR